MTRRPWLSVVMPTYCGAHHLVDALESVAAENLCGGVEVVVADDGSDDATVAVARSFADRLDLVVLEPKRRGSWVAATNDGVAAARGEWVSVLHQDDLWLRGRFAAVTAGVARADAAGSDLVVHASQMVADDLRPVGTWRVPFRAGTIEVGRAARSLYVQNWLAVPAATFRRQPVVEEPMEPELWYTADWDLWLRLARRGGLVVVPGTWSAFRLHAGSQTVQGSADSEDFRRQHTRVHERHAWVVADVHAARRTQAAARLSLETNLLLAGLAQGTGPPKKPWLAAALTTPTVWASYLRHSRIVDRSLPRVRAGLRRGARS